MKTQMDWNDPGTPTSGLSAPGAWLANLRSGLYLALFRAPGGSPFQLSAPQLIAIVATSLAASAAGAFILAGEEGRFAPQALPSELLWVLLALLAGYLVSRAVKDARYVLLVPIAAGSIGVYFTLAADAISYAADRGWFGVALAPGESDIYQMLFLWWSLALLLAIKRMTAQAPSRTGSPVLIVAIVLLLPAYFLPAEPLWETPVEDYEAGQGQPFSEQALYDQGQLLRDAEDRIEPQRPGVEDLYYVGFAPYAPQDVFMKETIAVSRLMEQRFGTAGRSVSLISNPAVADEYPIATLTSLRHVLRSIGERIDAQEDIVLLHLSSHGSLANDLAVEFQPLQLQQITPEDVRTALDDAGIKWRIVVVSACYSGGFVDALKDDNTLVVSASDATHASFGCGNGSAFTYFSQAYFNEALRQTWSFENAFNLARESIAKRERDEKLEPSNPLIAIGGPMRAKLARLEKR
jgi:hypothetical protein